MYYLTATTSLKTYRKEYKATDAGLRAARRFGIKKLNESNGTVVIHGHGISQTFNNKLNDTPTLEDLENE